MEVENNATYLEKSNVLSYLGCYLFRRLDWMIDDRSGRNTDEKLVQKLFSPPSAKLSLAGCQVVALSGKVGSVPLMPFKGPELSSDERQNGVCSAGQHHWLLL